MSKKRENVSEMQKSEPAEANSSQIVNIYEFLKQGDEETKLSPNEDIVLLLGNTGSGKSTLTQYITGSHNLTKSTLTQYITGSHNLTSQEVGEDTGEYIIVDTKNKISTISTILSKTIYPDLVIDASTKTRYYDCAGFSDTRSAAHEIAVTYFIKKLIDTSKSVKLVFVVNHHSVRKGVDRKDFVFLLKHAADLIKNIDKYRSSLALVVTKVDNIKKQGILVSDEKIIKGIGQYLEQVQQDIMNQPNLVASSNQPENILQRVLGLLDALLYKENEIYKRIGIFRRPDKSGPLTEIEILQNGKIAIQNIISISSMYL